MARRRPNRVSDRHDRARRAEDAAAAFVQGLGMEVLERNLRIGKLELDIVARDGAAVAIVEVRTRGRGAWEKPLASIGRVKRQRLSRAAAILWSRRLAKMPGVERVRFDVAAVDLDSCAEPVVEYIRAAFTVESC